MTNIDKEEQKSNEYYVSRFKNDDLENNPIISDLVEDMEGRKKYITPFVLDIFAVMEYLGVQAIGIHPDGKNKVTFMDSPYYKSLKEKVGKVWLLFPLRHLQKSLYYCGINYAERNIDSKKWKVNFEKIDKHLLETLNKSLEVENDKPES